VTQGADPPVADARSGQPSGHEDFGEPRDRESSGQPRDRDPAGRPRNARPRDGLGRPLDRAASGEPTTPEDLRLPPAQALALAQRLLDDGRPFHAHEVLEGTWKSVPAENRPLWQGLAQLAVGLTHARRGNAPGAVALLRRGAAAIDGYTGDHPPELDPQRVATAAADLADRISRLGLATLTEPDLQLPLVTRPR
jgi:hypothetical protein